MQTKIAPCAAACPVRTDVPGYVNAITRGDYAEAVRLIRAANPFASVCGWVCPHPCEDRCRRGPLDGPVSIRALKRFAIENAGMLAEAGNADPTGPRVAVLGAGPSGLSCAWYLARQGFRVTVWERQEKPGGQLQAALPVYRLPRQVLEKDINLIERAGVEIICGVAIGRDKSFKELRREHSAVVIATGLPTGRTCQVPGAEHPNVYTALSFLERAAASEAVFLEGRVVVIGGGDVAMDAARTARRYGASRVTVVCLEEAGKIPAHHWEIEESKEEGAEIVPGLGPWEIVDCGGHLAVSFKKVLSLFDARGRFDLRLAPEVALTLECEHVIAAIGQEPDYSFLQGGGVAFSRRGPVWDRETMMLSVPGVFICGEAGEGPGAAVQAVASGLAAGAAVAAYLAGRTPEKRPEPERIGPVPEREAALIPKLPRQPMPVRPVEERLREGRAPVELGFSEAAAALESSRCLSCGLGAVVDRGKCKACLTCARVCPYGVPRVGWTAVIPAEECQACGICAANCPAGAIALAKPVVVRPKPRAVTVFVCEKNRFEVQRFLDSLPVRPDYSLAVLPSAASINSLMVLEVLEKGADTAIVCTCGEDRCVHRCLDGVTARVAGIRRILGEIGLPAEKLILVNQSLEGWQAGLGVLTGGSAAAGGPVAGFGREAAQA